MSHVHLFYRLTTDGAPLTVLPLHNAAGEFVVHCRCCDTDWIEPSRKDAFDLAAAHTYISEASGVCASGRAAQHRHEHRARFGFYHRPASNWRVNH